MHQVAQLDRTAEKARRGHHKREDHRRLAEKAGKPDQVFLCPQQPHEVAQYAIKAATQTLVFIVRAAVQGNRFAVLAHPHQVVAEVSLQPLLLEVERNLRAADVMRQHAAYPAIQQRHPDHEAGNRVVRSTQAETEVAGQHPQNPHKTRQRDHRMQQAHRQPQRLRGELADVFLNPLIGVVGLRALCRAETRKLHHVKGLVR